VGLDDMGDAHRLLGRRFQVRLDVPLWIHHSTRSGAASAEDVARTPGARRENLSENHGDPPSVVVLSYAWIRYRVQSLVLMKTIGKTRR
jgi:hypothetical protein